MVTKTAGTQASGRRLCTAVTRTGDVCGLPLAQDESFCHRHDPGRAEERRKWASTAGKAKPLRESSAIRQRVLKLAEEVRRGEVEPKIANAIAVLSNVAISTLRLDTKIRELEDLEARIRQLETAVESDR